MPRREEPVVVDFKDTESRGGKKGSSRKHYPAGDYAVKCVKASLGRSGGRDSDDGKPRIEATYRFTNGKLKNKEIRDDLYLTPGALWRLRQTLEAMGIPVPSKKVKVDPKKMVGKDLAVSIDDEEYDNKTYSKVVDAFMISELEDLEEGDEDTETEDEDETEDEEVEEEEVEEETEDAEEEDELEGLDLDDL